MTEENTAQKKENGDGSWIAWSKYVIEFIKMLKENVSIIEKQINMYHTELQLLKKDLDGLLKQLSSLELKISTHLTELDTKISTHSNGVQKVERKMDAVLKVLDLLIRVVVTGFLAGKLVSWLLTISNIVK